ncbi:MAG TPA: phospholipase D-like domain-containing protein [Candidatus Dormibacteraeota bacterium]|nr:phospholipase D-like domain-containing protein [Candidatus Dormibacteraeota bacterium]
MRVTNSNSEVMVKAYAGVTGVLLAFNVQDESKKTGLLGFAIKRKKHAEPGTNPPARNAPDPTADADGFSWLSGMLLFPGQTHKPGDPIPTSVSPIQKFRWSDYAVRSGTTYTYRVCPVYGTAQKPDIHVPVEVTVKTGTWDVNTMLRVPNRRYALFNRAAGASQAFAREFQPDNDKINAALEKNAKKPLGKRKVPPLSPAALAWLSRGVKESIVNFIGQAKDSSWALDVAIYQYELPEIVDAVNAAFDCGAKVRLIYHAKPNDKQTAKNSKSAAHLPKADKVARVTQAIFHHKFIVLSKMNGEEREPQAVLAGSTNFTFNGVYCQANDLYVSTEAAIAQTYLNQFEHIFGGETVAETKARDSAQNIYDPAAVMQVGFSPRTGKTDLSCFVTLINSAKQDVLFSTAFGLEKSVEEALAGEPHDAILRFGVQDKASDITGMHADHTAQFTAASMLPKGLDGWLQEQHVKGQTGSILIHTKCIVVDFTSDHPIVISGSHNYSTNASASNDENAAIIRDDTDLADNFACEIMRIYDHYRFRYVTSHPTAKRRTTPPTLTPNDSWLEPYFDPNTLKYADRLVFSGYIANQGASAANQEKSLLKPSIQTLRAAAQAKINPHILHKANRTPGHRPRPHQPAA